MHTEETMLESRTAPRLLLPTTTSEVTMKSYVFNAPTDTNQSNPKVWDSLRKANAIQLWQSRITLKLIMCLITQQPNIEMLETTILSSTCQIRALKLTDARLENKDARKNTPETNCSWSNRIHRYKLELITKKNTRRLSVFSVLIQDRPNSMITSKYDKSRCVRVLFLHHQMFKALASNIKRKSVQ
jgi:hypothetical protein